MNDFGKQLKEFRHKTIDPQRDPIGRLTQARLAELLGDVTNISDKEVSFWETGRRKIPYTDRNTLVCLIKILHGYDGLQSLEEANNFLKSGLYASLSEEEIRRINLHWRAPQNNNRVNIGSSYIDIYSWESIVGWLDNIFQWSIADAHARTSWAGMVIWSMSSLIYRLTPNGLLNFFIAIFLWILVGWSLVPILQWPLTPVAIRQRAVILFFVAWFAMPLLLTLFTRADSSAIPERKEKNKLILFMLKFTGGLVGFNMVALILFFAAAGSFYISLSPTTWVWRYAVLAPLLMGHIGVKRIPADRLKMYDGALKAHSADWWFLGTFIATGPIIGMFVFWGFPYLANPAVGISLLLILLGITLWYRQNQQPLPELLLIFFLGFVIPLIIFLLFLFQLPSEDVSTAENSIDTVLSTILIISYFLSFSTLWITLQLRNAPTLTLEGVFTILVILLILLGLVSVNLFWGQIFSISGTFAWLVWGRNRLRSYLWIHQTFIWLIVITGSSLYLLFKNMIPIWLNLGCFITIVLGFIIWAYQPQFLRLTNN